MSLFVDLVPVEGEQRQVQEEHKPVAVEQKQHRDEPVQCGLWCDELVQLLAQFNRVYVIAFQVGKRDGEVNFGKQANRVDDRGRNEKKHLTEHPQNL